MHNGDIVILCAPANDEEKFGFRCGWCEEMQDLDGEEVEVVALRSDGEIPYSFRVYDKVRDTTWSWDARYTRPCDNEDDGNVVEEMEFDSILN